MLFSPRGKVIFPLGQTKTASSGFITETSDYIIKSSGFIIRTCGYSFLTNKDTFSCRDKQV